MGLYRDFKTQEEIDDEYRPEARISDPSVFEKLIASRKLQSEQALRELKRIADVAYGPTLIERLDIYPAKEPNAPIAVFIHGGYWFDARLTKETYIWTAKGFNAHGVTTIVIDYAVCPAVTIDEIVRQCRAALAWIYRNAGDFGGDRERIYVTGNSAGGHLTAMLALTDWEGVYGLPAKLMKGGCPISGLYELEPFPYSWLQPKIQLTGQQVRRNSPLFHVRRTGIPLLVSWGAEESREFWRQSESFAQAWGEAGNPVELYPQSGANHHRANAGFGDPDSELCRKVVAHMHASFGAQ